MKQFILALAVLLAFAQIACAYDLTHTWTSTVTNAADLKIAPCSSPTGPCSGAIVSSPALPLTATSYVQVVTSDGQYCSQVQYSRGPNVIKSDIQCFLVSLMSGSVSGYTVTGP